MAFQTLLVFCLSTVSLVVAEPCYSGWIYHEGKCYGVGDDKLTWGNAQITCISFGSTLAEIGTAAENEFIKDLGRNRSSPYFWLGGTDLFHEGIWEWVDSKQNIYDFTDWAPGQPGDVVGQDCLVMTPSDDFLWHDGTCEDQYDFVCEAVAREVIIG